jgi:hypothetical protein
VAVCDIVFEGVLLGVLLEGMEGVTEEVTEGVQLLLVGRELLD